MIKKYNQFINENRFYNETLNPQFWDENMGFNQRIKGKLLTITNDFIDGIKLEIEIDDIILTGSLANYNYNEHSDLDIHVVIDFKKINKDVDLVKIALDDERFMWNLKHNITIRGHEIEIYIQDITEVHKSSGIFSLQNNEWIKEPKYKEPKVDEEQVEFKTKEYQKTIDTLEKFSQDKNVTIEQLDEYFEYAKKLKSKIHEDRKEALNNNDGKEFSVENLVFKELRNSGHFGKLIDLINLFYDKQYIQEGLNNYLKGPNEEELKNAFMNKEIDVDKYIEVCKRNNYKLPTKEEIKKYKFQIKIDKQFIRAVDFNKLDNVIRCIENGADVHAENDKALRYACDNRMFKMVKYLIEQGADINVYNNYPLLTSIRRNRINIVKYLIENGAEITLSALREARKYKNDEIIELIKSQIELLKSKI